MFHAGEQRKPSPPPPVTSSNHQRSFPCSKPCSPPPRPLQPRRSLIASTSPASWTASSSISAPSFATSSPASASSRRLRWTAPIPAPMPRSRRRPIPGLSTSAPGQERRRARRRLIAQQGGAARPRPLAPLPPRLPLSYSASSVIYGPSPCLQEDAHHAPRRLARGRSRRPDLRQRARARPPSRRRLDPARQRAFLEVLADTGSVTAAAQAVGMARASAHRLRRRADARAFDAAGRRRWSAPCSYSSPPRSIARSTAPSASAGIMAR